MLACHSASVFPAVPAVVSCLPVTFLGLCGVVVVDLCGRARFGVIAGLSCAGHVGVPLHHGRLVAGLAVGLWCLVVLGSLLGCMSVFGVVEAWVVLCAGCVGR